MIRNIHKQRGGTVIGFIAGLIAGLTIAVIIAMVVTKTAIPFSQKHSRQGKISEAASASGPTSDPNKPLYGSASVVKESAKASATASVSELPRRAEAPTQTAVQVEPVKQVTTSDDPIADKIRQKSATPPSVQKMETGGDDKWTYLLQTNAYREPAEAQNERARLALSGFEAKISETTINGTKLYRVRLGPFATVDAMNAARSKLSDSGVSAAVVRIPK